MSDSRTPSTRTRAATAPAPRSATGPTEAGPLALPHEHDQVPEVRPDVRTRPQPEVAQAARDLRKGLVDTDNYTRVRGVAERSEGKPRDD